MVNIALGMAARALYTCTNVQQGIKGSQNAIQESGPDRQDKGQNCEDGDYRGVKRASFEKQETQ